MRRSISGDDGLDPGHPTLVLLFGGGFGIAVWYGGGIGIGGVLLDHLVVICYSAEGKAETAR
jgi:hypothetical protein